MASILFLLIKLSGFSTNPVPEQLPRNSPEQIRVKKK
jgi:hypothetical protein